MRCFVEVDLVQAEWVVTAFCSQDPRMLDVVMTGVDPHTRTGSLISGAPESFVIEEASIVGHNTDPIEIARRRAVLPKEWDGVLVSKFFLPRTMSIRQAGKKGNHGLNYKMGYKRFALEYGLEESDAARIVSTYRDIAYPGLKEYYKWIEHALRRDNRRLTNCFGQTRKFLAEWDASMLDAAYAFIPQSTVGVITNFGFKAVYEDEKALRRVDLKANVHDSLLNQHTFDSPAELVDQINVISNYMATPFEYHQREYTLRREVKLGFDWGEDSMIEVPVSEVGLVIRGPVEIALEQARAAQV